MAEPTIEQRFKTQVLPHLNSAFNLARWLTRNDPDAQDVTQEAYLRAFKFFPGFHGTNARAWLLTIVRNTFYTWHQQNRGQASDLEFDEDIHSLETGEAHQDSNPEALLARRENQQRVQRALRSLPLEFREVLVLRELEELSYKEIAAIVGIPMGTVMSRLGRGRQQLAAQLAPMKQEA